MLTRASDTTLRLPVTNFPGERIGDLAATRIAQEFISPRRRQHKGEIEALPAAQAGEWAAEKASLPVWKNPTMVVSPLQTSAPPDRCDSRRLVQSLGHELRMSETQSLMSERRSSDVSAVCLKPGTALTNKCAALSAVQELSLSFLGAMGVRNLSTRFSNLRDP